MNLNDIKNLNKTHNSTDKMPVLFVGHGSPMNAIEENEFSAGWRNARGDTSKTIDDIMCLGTLGDGWDICDGGSKTGDNSRFLRFPKGIVCCSISSSGKS
jgi:hypothetical protein